MKKTNFASKFTLLNLICTSVLLNLSLADSRPQVTGYNQAGQKVTVPGLADNEGCPESGSVSELKFVDACLAAKAQTMYTQDCSVLCSKNI